MVSHVRTSILVEGDLGNMGKFLAILGILVIAGGALGWLICWIGEAVLWVVTLGARKPTWMAAVEDAAVDPNLISLPSVVGVATLAAIAGLITWLQ